MEINSLFDDIDFLLLKAQFEELNKDYFRNSMGTVEECLCDCGIDKRNVHVVALIAGSARIPIVQKMIQELFTELIVLSSLHTKTVLPMSWESRTV